MATWLAVHQAEMSALRSQVAEVAPEVELVPDLRLVDMVVWTSWDEVMPGRRTGQGVRWSQRTVGERPLLEDMEPVPVPITRE